MVLLRRTMTKHERIIALTITAVVALGALCIAYEIFDRRILRRAVLNDTNYY